MPFESIHDVLRFLVRVAHRTGAATEPEVNGALAYIDAHEEGTDGEAGSKPVPELTPEEEAQLAALQAKQDAALAAAARPLAEEPPADAYKTRGYEPASHDV